eukprot:902997_1
MIAELKALKEELVGNRNDMVKRIKHTYKQYISELCIQQQMILDAITLQYNNKIDYFETLIEKKSKIEQDKLKLTQMERDFKKLIYPQSSNVNIHSLLIIPTRTLIRSSPVVVAISSNIIEEDDTNTTNVIVDNGFVLHMTLDEASQLRVNDMVDHRDIEGCFVSAKVIGQTGTALHLHYPGWDDKWNVWNDYNTELYKFAKHKSISQRPRHRLFALKINDFVDVNPCEHKGWRIGKVEEIDLGQVKITYDIDDERNEVSRSVTWAHIDNRKEIEALHTFTSAEQMMIHDDETNIASENHPSESNDSMVCEKQSDQINYNPIELSNHIAMPSVENTLHDEETEEQRRPQCDDDKSTADTDPEAIYEPPSTKKSIAKQKGKKQIKEKDKQQKRVEDIQQFKCPYTTCKRAFQSKFGLTNHIRNHTGERPYQCSYDGCDKAFGQKCTLIRHIRTHTGEKPYECSYNGCGKAFSQKYNLTQHIRIHTGEKPYQCSYNGCSKAFTLRNTLNIHIRTHTGEKPYQCNICKKRFGDAGSRNYHVKNV